MRDIEMIRQAYEDVEHLWPFTGENYAEWNRLSKYGQRCFAFQHVLKHITKSTRSVGLAHRAHDGDLRKLFLNVVRFATLAELPSEHFPARHRGGKMPTELFRQCMHDVLERCNEALEPFDHKPRVEVIAAMTDYAYEFADLAWTVSLELGYSPGFAFDEFRLAVKEGRSI